MIPIIIEAILLINTFPKSSRLKLKNINIMMHAPAKANPFHFSSVFIYPPNFKREVAFPLVFNIKSYNTRLNKAVE